MPEKYLNDVNTLSSMIQMLITFGQIDEAEHYFRTMNKFDISVYSKLMVAYALNDQPRKCLDLLNEIEKKSLFIDKTTSLLLLSVASRIGMMNISKKFLNIIPNSLLENRKVQAALINMWGKVSSIEEAEKIFESMAKPDTFAYNSMINAYGLNGMGRQAVQLYRNMSRNNQDEVSHICVLNACSHSGLIDMARQIFDEIHLKTRRIFTTMVDCLSRMSMFDQAQNIIDQYEKLNSPSIVMYMTLLSGARNHRSIDLSKKIYERMINLFPDEKSTLISASILVSNTYSAIGDRNQSEEIRRNRIKQLGNKLKLGLSWTEINGDIVEFQAHDRSHPRSNEIYDELEILSKELKDNGHQFDSTWIIRPLNENETDESILCGHSEKLAIAFNFIQQPKPSIIQITKNLRVCGDCHNATKIIAKIRQCDIVIRDSNRIHHFHKTGHCSCQDHF